jgi:ketosteroid isomerase-like protein
MRQDVIRFVESYIDAVRRDDADVLPLHSDVVFESPLNHSKGIAEFRKGLADLRGMHCEARVPAAGLLS